jgi:hypothetical protein
MIELLQAMPQVFSFDLSRGTEPDLRESRESGRSSSSTMAAAPYASVNGGLAEIQVWN